MVSQLHIGWHCPQLVLWAAKAAVVWGSAPLADRYESVASQLSPLILLRFGIIILAVKAAVTCSSCLVHFFVRRHEVDSCQLRAAGCLFRYHLLLLDFCHLLEVQRKFMLTTNTGLRGSL